MQHSLTVTIASALCLPAITLILLLFRLDPDVSASIQRNEHPPPTAVTDTYYFEERTHTGHQALECTHVVGKCNLVLTD